MSPRGAKLNEHMRVEATKRITQAALEVFTEYGYHGATMNRIMQVSGLSKGLVYHYFRSKEGIFFHLVDSALAISKTIWREALDTPGTAWDKIEKLSENLVRTAFTEESSLYFLIMVQAITQGKSIPGLMEHIRNQGAHYAELPLLIVKAQRSGKAVPGDPELLAYSYLALFQGFTLFTLQDDDMKKNISPETFTHVLRKQR